MKTPPASVNGPLIVIAVVPPVKVPPDWLNPVAPTVTVEAPDCVMVPA